MVAVNTQTPSTSEILKDQLYLGNFAAAECPEYRRKLGFTHLISVCHERPSTSLATSAQLQVSVDDTEYEDLLIYLPTTSRFIQSVLEEGGKVLVHCVMGVSRSTTVVAAFLMKHRKMDARSALRYIKQRRPQVHPNYGFIKQLDTYAKCQFDPCATNPVYRSWKKRQQQDVTSFLNQLVDTASIIPDKLLLNSDFPEDPRQAESFLADLGITHVLSISPVGIPSSALEAVLKSKSHYKHMEVRNNAKEDLLLALPVAVQFLEQAMANGLVLVHSKMEVRACTVACACLMKQQHLAPDEAFSAIEDTLPLFNPTVNFSRNLELYDACGYLPTEDHPVVREWVKSHSIEASFSKMPNGHFTSGYARRPSGTIIASSTSRSGEKSSSNRILISHPPSLQKPPQPYPRSRRDNTLTGRTSTLPLNSGICPDATCPSEMDLGAQAKDILSNTGFDLTGFANTLKEIEQAARARNSTGNITSSTQRAAESPLYC